MASTKTYTESRLWSDLNALPELVGACMRHGGNIAFNIEKYGDNYRFQIGVRKEDSFVLVGDPVSESIPSGKTLVDLAEAELLAMGEKSGIPDVFVEGKLYRPASQK